MSRLVAALAILLGCAVLAGGAHAATSSQAGSPGTVGVSIKGSTVIRLDRALFTDLASREGAVRALKPATATLTGAKFKVVNIGTGPDGTSYLIRHKGAMRISTPLRSVAFANPTLSIDGTTGAGQVTATVKGKRVRMAALQIDLGGLEQTGEGVSADNVALTMSARTAKELNRVTGTRTYAAGDPLGKATVRVITEA